MQHLANTQNKNWDHLHELVVSKQQLNATETPKIFPKDNYQLFFPINISKVSYRCLIYMINSHWCQVLEIFTYQMDTSKYLKQRQLQWCHVSSQWFRSWLKSYVFTSWNLKCVAMADFIRQKASLQLTSYIQCA